MKAECCDCVICRTCFTDYYKHKILHEGISTFNCPGCQLPDLMNDDIGAASHLDSLYRLVGIWCSDRKTSYVNVNL